MKADLHVHSTASDGTLTPREVILRAHANGVGVLALSDHDTIAGLAEARAAADEIGITLINAVELSATWDEIDVHILGYFVDPEDPMLEARLAEFRSGRARRAEQMVAALAEGGYAVTLEDVMAISGGGAVGRSHIARALVAAGYAETATDAFKTLIGRSQRFYVAKEGAEPAEVVAWLRECGAVPVVAHPGVTGADPLVEGMVASGLLGIEAYHADHTPEQVAHYAALAKRYGLLVTGGSDFHGPHSPNPDIGSVELPEGAVEALFAAGERAHRR